MEMYRYIKSCYVTSCSLIMLPEYDKPWSIKEKEHDFHKQNDHLFPSLQ